MLCGPGSWFVFFEIIGYAAIFTNLGVVVFTRQDPFFGLDSIYHKLVAFIVIEHVLFGIKFLLGRMISDIPHSVVEAKERQVRVGGSCTSRVGPAVGRNRVSLMMPFGVTSGGCLAWERPPPTPTPHGIALQRDIVVLHRLAFAAACAGKEAPEEQGTAGPGLQRRRAGRCHGVAHVPDAGGRQGRLLHCQPRRHPHRHRQPAAAWCVGCPPPRAPRHRVGPLVRLGCVAMFVRSFS